jgi:hypothetical protein
MPRPEAALLEEPVGDLESDGYFSGWPALRHAHPGERAAWTFVWLAVLTGGVNLWGFWWSSPVVVALAPLMVLLGLVGIVWSWTVEDPRRPWFQAGAFAAVLAAVVFPQIIEISTRAFYATDAAAADQTATQSLVHGVNPYVVSMASAAHLLSAPARFWTYTVTGGFVSHFSYPAGSFLVDVPAWLLGVHHMVVDWMDLVAWLVTVCLVFFFLPVRFRWAACLLALTPFLLGEFSSGGTNAIVLPFLVVAVWRWDRFGLGRGAGAARWIGPIALGVACAIKQTPSFCVPFLVAGVAIEARRSGRDAVTTGLRYAGTVAGVFLLVNLPFIVWSPGPWLRGTLLPLRGGLVADGQGLATLATHGLTGGVNLTLLGVAGGLALATVVAAFVAWYPQLKPVWLPLGLIPFFVAPRSLSSYFVDLVPAAVVAALTVEPISTVPGHARALVGGPRVRRAVAALGAGAIACSALAFVGHPLALSVRGATTALGGQRLESVTITVDNLGSRGETPHFMVNTGTTNNAYGFWLPRGGHPVRIAPHASVVLTLFPPAVTRAPRPGTRWLVEAYTTGPTWLSTTALQVFPPTPPRRAADSQAARNVVVQPVLDLVRRRVTEPVGAKGRQAASRRQGLPHPGLERRHRSSRVDPVGAENVIHAPGQGLSRSRCANNNVGNREQ